MYIVIRCNVLVYTPLLFQQEPWMYQKPFIVYITTINGICLRVLMANYT